MKSLIRKMSFAICTLLLTCTFCLAQIEFNTSPPPKVWMTVSGDSTRVMCGGAELITIKLLIEYETDCYNDSTKTTYDFYKWGNDTIMQTPSIDPGHTMGYIGRKTIYEHKQPTFKDFVRWAAKKYGL